MESSFGPLEEIKKHDKHFDLPEEVEHRKDCPMYLNSLRSDTRTTLCMCKELDRADRLAEAEDRADDDRKYGGL